MPHPPVVFVPGLGGSFNLPIMLDWRGPTTSGWNFPPFIDYGKGFLAAFARAGYTRDRDLFVAFYDWRKSVSDNARDYLVPWIDRARARSGSAKVVLVGHSMGGLVSRSYIQSSAYRNDVDRLITLGTPHRGSAEAYYPWEGGELRWDSAARTVIEVYLWYLQHFHPFQSDLNRLKTIRALVPGLRDLLPIDDYLVDQGASPQARSEETLRERNLWGDILNTPDGLATLFGRVQVTAISSVGFSTIQSIVVGAPPQPPENPARYPDGAPLSDRSDGNGDGTVPLASARLDDPRARHVPLTNIAHDQLADQSAPQVLAELGISVSAAPQVAATPRLVILTASPVEMTVEPPTAPPAAAAGVLGEAALSPRRRGGRGRMRMYTYGHTSKRLSMAIIPWPENAAYTVRLRGTATGSFTLGALVVGAQGAAVLNAEEGLAAVQQPTISSITTVDGQVADQTELRYQVTCTSYAAPPDVRFDAEATARDALTRLSAATQAPAPGVLGAADGGPATSVLNALTDAGAPEHLRDAMSAALSHGDTAALQALAAALGAESAGHAALLSRVVEQVIAPRDQTLALGLLEQLRRITSV